MTGSPRPLSRQTRLLALRAFLAGRRAAREGRPITACPFQPDATASDANAAAMVSEATVERFLAQMWLRGWNRQTAKNAAA